MDDGIQPAAFEPVLQFGRRHDVRELALGEIAPFAVMAEHVANGDIRAAGVVQRGDDVRSDKTGSTGHQQHSLTLPFDVGWQLCPSPARQATWVIRQGEGGSAPAG